MAKKSVLILIGILIFALHSHAEDASGQAGAYLKMGVGARALGMGGAFTAIADDSTAAFWNPAGLSQLEKKEITTMHAMLKLDRTYNFLNYVQPLPKRKAAWGVNYVRFGVDDISETHIWRYVDANNVTRTQVYGTPVLTTDGKVIPVLQNDAGFEAFWEAANTQNNPVNSYNDWKNWKNNPANGVVDNIDIFSVFDDNEWTFSLSYAQQLRNEKCLLGGNLKYLKQELFDYSADSFAMDLGFLYMADQKLNWALSFRDVGANLKWDTPSGHKDRVPVTSTLGLAYFPNSKVNVALDYSKIQDGESLFHFGVEGFIREKFGLRGGLDDGDFTVGASFKASEWNFDYAFRDQELGNEHRLSASYRF